MSDGRTIAVLGAGGIMGLPMARNLARAGFAVRAWNRTGHRAESLADDGARVVDEPADAARCADVIVTMLTDADTVVSCIDRATAAGNAAGAVWLQMSTIGEQGTERCSKLADQRGLTLIDAPVLGTKAPAERGELVILASGPEEMRDRVAPIFDVIGHRTMWVGETGAGSRLKLAVNTWILSVVEGAAETLALAAGLGLDPHLVLDAVSGGPVDLPYLRMKGTAMIERDFTPSFRLTLAAKDASLVDEAAAARGLDLPLVRTIRDRLAQGAREHPDEDMSATFLTSLPPRAT